MSGFAYIYEDPDYDDDLSWQELEDWEEDQMNETLSPYETVNS